MWQNTEEIFHQTTNVREIKPEMLMWVLVFGGEQKGRGKGNAIVHTVGSKTGYAVKNQQLKQEIG